MARDRWNLGKPSLGDSFTPGFVSPWNAPTRAGHGDYTDIATIPTSPIPGTMAEQMDGDQQINFADGGNRGRKRAR